MELYPNSDFLFSKSDFIDEFYVFDDQYDLFWFDEVRKLETFQYYSVETLVDDVTAVGFKIGRIEFYIGTLNGEWCLFSNRNLDGRFLFRNAPDSTNLELINWLSKEYSIPVEITYSIVRIAKKYKSKKVFSNGRNFSSWMSNNPESLTPPLCLKCNLPVRKHDFIPEDRFTKGISNPPWNSGWQGICENCNHSYNFSSSQLVSAELFKIERRSLVKLAHKDYMDSLDSFVILSGVEISISEIINYSGKENQITNSNIFISTNELNFILKSLKNSPLLDQYDWDADTT